MSRPLAGAFAKVARAQEHIHTLDNAIKHFVESNPCPVVIEPYRHHLQEVIVIDSPENARQLAAAQRVNVGVQVHPLPGGRLKMTMLLVDRAKLRMGEVAEHPAEEWGVVIGEIVHNLRSALDHLAFGLTVARKGLPPDPFPTRGP